MQDFFVVDDITVEVKLLLVYYLIIAGNKKNGLKLTFFKSIDNSCPKLILNITFLKRIFSPTSGHNGFMSKHRR